LTVSASNNSTTPSAYARAKSFFRDSSARAVVRMRVCPRMLPPTVGEAPTSAVARGDGHKNRPSSCPHEFVRDSTLDSAIRQHRERQLRVLPAQHRIGETGDDRQRHNELREHHGCGAALDAAPTLEEAEVDGPLDVEVEVGGVYSRRTEPSGPDRGVPAATLQPSRG
jgi:hypothetical protein